MRLKGLGNRAYNVIFHTHTVAGIVISFALFVIFYAGAFSLFKDEIKQWENPDLRQPVPENVRIDETLSKFTDEYDLNFHESHNLLFPSVKKPVVTLYGAYNDTDSTTERMAAYWSPADSRIQDIREEPLTTVGDTIYYLHYFRQIPVIGIYIAGFVGLFFLFAIITGVLIHWRNLLTKFYAFIKEGKWKAIWTNAHTVLGIIGLPFQFMYALTGAFFGLLILFMLPMVFLLFDGDIQKAYDKLFPFNGIQLEENAEDADHLTLDHLYDQLQEAYPEFHISNVQLKNYGKADAMANWFISDEKGISSGGSLVMYLKDGKVIDEYSSFPYRKPYHLAVFDYIFKLHFGDFGGFFIKIIYFVLSMITCFMIISGILIWRTARDNDRYTYKQKLFHHRVTKSYLAICLSMYPAFALIFILNKMIPFSMDGRVTVVNALFFSGWLLMTLIGLLWNNYSRQNRNYLVMGGVLALLIPISNGLVTQDWFWITLTEYPWVAFIDIFWLVAGIVSLYLSFYVLKIKTTSDKPELSEEQNKVVEDSAIETVESQVLEPQLVGFTKSR